MFAGGQASVFLQWPGVWDCLSIIKRREIEDLKILDTNETGTLENSRETPPKKETDFWVALGAQVRLQTRNLQIARHGIQAFRQTLVSWGLPRIVCHLKSEEAVGTKMVSWAQTHSWHSVGGGQGSKIWNWRACQCTFLTRLIWLWVPEWWAGDA